MVSTAEEIVDAPIGTPGGRGRRSSAHAEKQLRLIAFGVPAWRSAGIEAGGG